MIGLILSGLDGSAHTPHRIALHGAGLNVLFLGGFVASMAVVVCTVTSSSGLIEEEGEIVVVDTSDRDHPSRRRGAHTD